MMIFWKHFKTTKIIIYVKCGLRSVYNVNKILLDVLCLRKNHPVVVIKPSKGTPKIRKTLARVII